MKITKSASGFEIQTDAYKAAYNQDTPLFLNLGFSNGVGADLFIPSGCDRDELIDEVIALNAPEISETPEGATVVFEGKTTLWGKVDYIFECREDKVLYHFKVYGAGRLDEVCFFGGFEADNPNIKGKAKPLFCGPGRHISHHRPPEFFMTASRPGFDVVFSSAVTSTDDRTLMYYEDSRIGGTGDRNHHGGDWLATPPPFLYLLGTRSKNRWVSAGLVVNKGEYNFKFYEYKGGEKFRFTLDYDGYTEIAESWESPKILFEESDDIYAGLEQYVDYLRQNGYVTKNDRSNMPDWWREPIFGGWGEQMYHSNHWESYWGKQSFGWSGSGAHMCTMEIYDKMLATLEKKRLDPVILIVDNRWFKEDNQLEADETIWPDMKGWIRKQHEKGRKVILWVSPFNYSRESAGSDVPMAEHLIGIPHKVQRLEIDTDVFYSALGLEKRKVKKPYTYQYGEKPYLMQVDALNPDYEARVREKVHYLLSPDGLDADGFEFDYTHFGAKERGYEPVSGRKDMIWGTETIHHLLGIYYDAAKKAKPDALCITHTYNPYFDDVTDMLRLQDIYTDEADIVDLMTHRGRLASISCPGCAIHTDQHPMPSLAAWRAYAKAQPSIGNPCLYYVTGIETTYEEFTEDDYQLLRDTWKAYRESLVPNK